jgi:hypothetical protein
VIVIENSNVRRKRTGRRLDEGRVVNLAGEIGGFVEKHGGSAEVARFLSKLQKRSRLLD